MPDLQQRVEELLAAHNVPADVSLVARPGLADVDELLAAGAQPGRWSPFAAELESGRGVTPAAEWLLDNYHLVEDQIREIREDLPAGYYRQLPKLSGGPFVGYPRVFGIAWAYVAHTDSHFDPETLRRYLVAYQQV